MKNHLHHQTQTSRTGSGNSSQTHRRRETETEAGSDDGSETSCSHLLPQDVHQTLQPEDERQRYSQSSWDRTDRRRTTPCSFKIKQTLHNKTQNIKKKSLTVKHSGQLTSRVSDRTCPQNLQRPGGRKTVHQPDFSTLSIHISTCSDHVSTSSVHFSNLQYPCV